MQNYIFLPTFPNFLPTISFFFATWLHEKCFTFVLEMKTFLKILTLFIAAGAVGGAVMMWMDPTGESWGGEPMLDLAVLIFRTRVLIFFAGTSFYEKL